MFDYILNFEFNSWLAIFLYWSPLLFCAYGYTLRTWQNYQKDVAAVKVDKLYSPTDTIGTLIGRGLVTAIPIANLWAAAFDLAPKIFGDFFEWVGRVFDTPLVPPPKDKGGTPS